MDLDSLTLESLSTVEQGLDWNNLCGYCHNGHFPVAAMKQHGTAVEAIKGLMALNPLPQWRR